MQHLQTKQLEEIRTLYLKIDKLDTSYWFDYSNIESWEFWFSLIILVAPLVILYFTLDRSKIFQILFFGYTIHVIMDKLDTYEVANGLTQHAYHLLPESQINLSMDTSLIPVLFMLTYQFTMNKKKNVYLFGALISGFAGLFLGRVFQDMGFLILYKPMTIWYLFFEYYLEFIVAYWLTNMFIYLRRRGSPIKRFNSAI